MNAAPITTTADIALDEMADIYTLVSAFATGEREGFEYIGSGISRETWGFETSSGRRFVVKVSQTRVDQSNEELRMSAHIQAHPVLRSFAAPAMSVHGLVVMPMVIEREGVTRPMTTTASAILSNLGFSDCHSGNFKVTEQGPVMFDLGFGASLSTYVDTYGTLDAWEMPDAVADALAALQRGESVDLRNSEEDPSGESSDWGYSLCRSTPERTWRWTADNCANGTPDAWNIGERWTRGTQRPGATLRAGRLARAIDAREAQREAERAQAFVPSSGCLCDQCNGVRAERGAMG